MTLPAIRSAIIDALEAAGLGDAVESHPGRLSVADLKSLVVRGKSTIRVACIGIPAIALSDIGPQFDLQWAAYIMTLDSAGLDRDQAALIITGSIGKLVPGNLWGREDLDSPAAIRADNLYSGTLQKRAVALWAITWRQQWTPQLPESGTLDDLLSVVASWDLDTDSDGEPLPIDTIELEGGS